MNNVNNVRLAYKWLLEPSFLAKQFHCLDPTQKLNQSSKLFFAQPKIAPRNGKERDQSTFCERV
jgi:hypothetical protein